MELIDKSAVVAEIERRIAAYRKNFDKADNKIARISTDGRIESLKNILSFLDTLEVREVNLEDSIKENLAQKYIDYTFKRHNINPESKEGQLIYYAYMHGMNQCIDKLKAQEGE